MCGRTETIVSIPVVNTVSTRPVTDLMEVICLAVILGSMEINVIMVHFMIESIYFVLKRSEYSIFIKMIKYS